MNRAEYETYLTLKYGKISATIEWVNTLPDEIIRMWFEKYISNIVVTSDIIMMRSTLRLWIRSDQIIHQNASTISLIDTMIEYEQKLLSS